MTFSDLVEKENKIQLHAAGISRKNVTEEMVFEDGRHWERHTKQESMR